VIWIFYDLVVKLEKGWVEQEFVLLIIGALPSEAGLPNEKISYRIVNYLLFKEIIMFLCIH
jgi:hypothetical protein